MPVSSLDLKLYQLQLFNRGVVCIVVVSYTVVPLLQGHVF